MGKMNVQAKRDKAAYKLAWQFLRNADESLTEEVLQRVVTPPRQARGLPAILRQLLESARSSHMKHSVIGDLSKLRKVLFEFSPRKIVAAYGRDDTLLMAQVQLRGKPSGQVRFTPRSIWPQFCRTILSGANFLSQFSSGKEFFKFVATFERGHRDRLALPMLLAREVHGLGFALACDFLKELGRAGFCKPDVHLRKIMCGLQLTDSPDDYEVFRSIIRVANNNGTTPYEVDKLFWIIGSGRTGQSKAGIGRRADEFIQYAQGRVQPL